MAEADTALLVQVHSCAAASARCVSARSHRAPSPPQPQLSGVFPVAGRGACFPLPTPRLHHPQYFRNRFIVSYLHSLPLAPHVALPLTPRHAGDSLLKLLLPPSFPQHPPLIKVMPLRSVARSATVYPLSSSTPHPSCSGPARSSTSPGGRFRTSGAEPPLLMCALHCCRCATCPPLPPPPLPLQLPHPPLFATPPSPMTTAGNRAHSSRLQTPPLTPSSSSASSANGSSGINHANPAVDVLSPQSFEQVGRRLPLQHCAIVW